MSHFTFILCAEVLSGLISKSQQDGHIHGVSIATNAPRISHLLYVHDCILFYKARPKEGRAIKEILDQYQEASGKRVNLDKSDMFFSPNISMDLKKLFQKELPIKISINKY